ncbi:cytochrome P450 [Staphylotrichum tortipilum]|uniref:Cytochrome P450 n=1 Tax=Staphylotrichum tortipilum TaxID=2831512 RepID=A0AAN6MUL6_9PEZI|nr:cytochrome P450 [Staphylotrichum longicolle]
MGYTYTPSGVLSFAPILTIFLWRILGWWFVLALPTGLGTILTLYWGVWRSWVFPYFFSPLRHVPTVPGFPLWGQFMPIILEECGVPQRRWHDLYGPVIRYSFPLGCERLSFADDAGLKHLTTKNPYNFPKPVRAKLWMVRILGEGVLLAEGEEHIYHRKVLTPGFSLSAVRDLAPFFWDKALFMAELQQAEMEADAQTTGKFEILEWLNRCTLDIIGEAGFGYDIDSLRFPDLPIRDAYRLVFNFDFASSALHGIQAFFPQSRHIPAQMNRDMEQARKMILEQATTIINDRINDAKHNRFARDILSLIAQENTRLKVLGETGLSFETMRDQIMTFLGAGHDTTATGAAWALYMLAIHQDIQARLRDEIREYIPTLFEPFLQFRTWSTRLPDPDKLPYLNKVCREALRFIPPIPMTVREAQVDDIVYETHVPAGTIVYMLANAINRMEWFWGPDADLFNPDRWDSLPKTVVPNAYMTFLQGPRGCLGRKFAELEMKILLCVFVSTWEFVPDFDNEDPEDLKMWRLVLRPMEGITLLMRPITRRHLGGGMRPPTVYCFS